MKDKLKIKMTWKAFQHIVYTFVRRAKNDEVAHDVYTEMGKLCFCADIMIELQKKKVDIPKIIGAAKYIKIQQRYTK